MAVIHAYDVSLRASKKREQELKEELAAAQRNSQEKDKQCSKLDNDLYDMYKKMVAAKYDYEQAQEQLEKLQQKGIIKRHNNAHVIFVFSTSLLAVCHIFSLSSYSFLQLKLVSFLHMREFKWILFLVVSTV